MLANNQIKVIRQNPTGKLFFIFHGKVKFLPAFTAICICYVKIKGFKANISKANYQLSKNKKSRIDFVDVTSIPCKS